MPFKSSFKAILHFFLHPFSPKSVWSEEGYIGKQNIQFTSCFSSKAVKYCDSPWEGSGRHKCLTPDHVLSTGHNGNQSWAQFWLRPLSLSCMVLLGWICTSFSFIRKLPSLGAPIHLHPEQQWSFCQAPQFFTSWNWCFFCLSSYYQKNVLSCLSNWHSCTVFAA